MKKILITMIMVISLLFFVGCGSDDAVVDDSNLGEGSAGGIGEATGDIDVDSNDGTLSGESTDEGVEEASQNVQDDLDDIDEVFDELDALDELDDESLDIIFE